MEALVPQGGSHSFKSQKSKVLWNEVFRDFKWLPYFRCVVLEELEQLQQMKYSILIQWSETDQVYVASLPEWGQYARTHGETYEEAFENAREVLEDLVYGYEQTGKPLPTPQTLQVA